MPSDADSPEGANSVFSKNGRARNAWGGQHFEVEENRNSWRSLLGSVDPAAGSSGERGSLVVFSGLLVGLHRIALDIVEGGDPPLSLLTRSIAEGPAYLLALTLYWTTVGAGMLMVVPGIRGGALRLLRTDPCQQADIRFGGLARSHHLIERDHAPVLGRNKSWFFQRDDKGRGFFLAFINAKGSYSVRTFNAETGIFRGKRYRPGNYQDRFADLIEGATELTVQSQPNLERDCKERLPKKAFEYLRSPIKK